MPALLSATDWLHSFEPFSAVHGAMILLTAVIIGAIVWIGRRWRTTARATTLERALAGAALLIWIAANGWWMLPRNFTLANSIPIHVTDVIGLCVPLALIFAWRWMRAILYFWGFGLATQAFISPVVTHGPAAIAFWMFWLGHIVILAAVIYDVAVRGFRPTWRDYRIALLALICYVVVVLPIDILLDANYGYLGRATPQQPTLMDLLGPWPFRLLPMTALAAIALAIPMLPWIAIRPPKSQKPTP